jgi:hypothetical protein
MTTRPSKPTKPTPTPARQTDQARFTWSSGQVEILSPGARTAPTKRVAGRQEKRRDGNDRRIQR